MRYDDPDNDYGRQKRGQRVLLSALTKVNKSKKYYANEFFTRQGQR